MTVDPLALLIIACMALVTYATRLSGFLLVGRLGGSKRLEGWLHYVPGAVLVAIIAPSVLPEGLVGSNGVSGALTGGPAELVAAAVAAAVAVRTKNLLLAMISGVVAVWIVRNLLRWG